MFHLPRPAQSRLFVALLLVALGLRALVPEGFMPAPGRLVELCTEHGLQRMLVDTQTGEILGSEDDTAATTCPWSLLLTTLAAPALPPAAQALAVTRETPPGRALAPSTASGTPTPPVRAPPRLA
ncbi:DUF2946 family protein [Thioalkalivibrio sp. XN279]|uniref:DUF2946 family protein n=1 Tax=Thioalkalivibrio sp. XN279 TaxID=2714953 RepID=UPI00140B368D|nr:DUF2946 family protein [Thioalkalivibrio sp. XN279]NHA13541.1 hypothetical protein [Thioalkalivibrio sp. XN279]